jgi:UPF0042 nucleotide-binding protein
VKTTKTGSGPAGPAETAADAIGRKIDLRNPGVAAHVADDTRFAGFFQRLQGLILFRPKARPVEGKAHLTIGFGRKGGQHRSVAVAEKLGIVLSGAGWMVLLRHRGPERRAQGASGLGTG